MQPPDLLHLQGNLNRMRRELDDGRRTATQLDVENRRLKQLVRELKEEKAVLKQESETLQQETDKVQAELTAVILQRDALSQTNRTLCNEQEHGRIIINKLRNQNGCLRRKLNIETLKTDRMKLEVQRLEAVGGSESQNTVNYGECSTVRVLQSNLQGLLIRRAGIFKNLQDLRGSVRVFCRPRPLTNKEPSASHLQYLSLGSAQAHGLLCGSKLYTFNKVFKPETTQGEVYDEIASLVESALHGQNVSIFAYGQTGSGKTHTMYGDHQERGVIPRAVQHIFRIIRERSTHRKQVQISAFEFFKNNINDLFATKPPARRLRIREERNGGRVHIPGLTCVTTSNETEALMMIQRGYKRRSEGATAMNKNSSRSHLVIELSINKNGSCSGEHTSSKLSMVDLAGLERITKSKATGKRLEEATYINRSLSALGNVFTAIDRNAKHVPYRDCPLTHYLRDGLGGDASTLMIATLSGHSSDTAESIGTLQFASTVSKVHLRKIQGSGVAQQAARLERELIDLDRSIAELRG